MKNKVHIKCDYNYGSVSSGIRRPIDFSFDLDLLPGYKIFCEPGTKHHENFLSLLTIIFFFMENIEWRKIDFIGETKTFTIIILII